MHFWKLVTLMLGPDYFVMCTSYRLVFTLLPANRLIGLPQFIIRMMYFLLKFFLSWFDGFSETPTIFLQL